MGVNEFIKKSKEELKKELTKDQFEVTQKNATEAPYSNAYFNEFREGIYVDITTGEPLFVSADKYDSGCGWPSFAKPLDQELIVTKSDQSYGMMRTEVRSKLGDAHLGHVFDDGIEALGGLRYCINSASLKFISKDQLEEVGYGKYKRLFECTGDKE